VYGTCGDCAQPKKPRKWPNILQSLSCSIYVDCSIGARRRRRRRRRSRRRRAQRVLSVRNRMLVLEVVPSI
jgi:hypothetical protein